MTKDDFIKKANQERKANKNDWVFLMDKVGENNVHYKAYKTWIQSFYVGKSGINHASSMGLSVKEFNEALNEAFDYEGVK